MQVDDHAFHVKLEAFLQKNSEFHQDATTSLHPSIIQASDFEILTFLEDQRDEDLEEVKQVDEEIRSNLKCSNEEGSMNQEITTNDKEE